MLGQIVRSPLIWDKTNDQRKGIFLAGGITNCPLWQDHAAQRIANALPVVVLDPRRDNWELTNGHVESVLQISWECKHLKKSDHILFWFPSTSDCSIALFELGSYLEKRIPITIGTDCAYTRRFDVEVQSAMVRPRIVIWDNLDKMIDHLIANWNQPFEGL
jgi:hypothetical protein